MKLRTGFRSFIILTAAASFAVCLFAQSASDASLVVNGKNVRGALREIDGRPYADLELLAQALGASIHFESHRISLNMPVAPATAPPPANSARAALSTAQNMQRLSPEFASAAISALAAMRQWQGAVEAVIRFGIPANGTWPKDYRDNAEAGLNQARVAASSGGDQSAVQLLQSEFASLNSWSDSVITERQSLHAARFVDPNALANDSALSKISSCGGFLGSMIVSGVFSEGSACQ